MIRFSNQSAFDGEKKIYGTSSHDFRIINFHIQIEFKLLHLTASCCVSKNPQGLSCRKNSQYPWMWLVQWCCSRTKTPCSCIPRKNLNIENNLLNRKKETYTENAPFIYATYPFPRTLQLPTNFSSPIKGSTSRKLNSKKVHIRNQDKGKISTLEDNVLVQKYLGQPKQGEKNKK